MYPAVPAARPAPAAAAASPSAASPSALADSSAWLRGSGGEQKIEGSNFRELVLGCVETDFASKYSLCNFCRDLQVDAISNISKQEIRHLSNHDPTVLCEILFQNEIG